MQSASAPPVREFEFRTIGGLLRRQIRVIMLTTLFIFGLAAIFLLTITQTYSATALVLVDPDRQSILNPGTAFPASAGRDNARVDSEVEILRSNAVAMAVIESQGLIGDPEFGAALGLSEKLARSVGIAYAASPLDRQATAKTLNRFKDATTIRRKGLTYLITVSTSSKSPARAAFLANSLAKAYITQQVEAKVSRSLAARDVLNTQIIAAQLSLTSYETTFSQFLEKNLDQVAEGTEMSGLRTALSQAELSLQQKEQDQLGLRQLLRQEDWAALGNKLGDSQLRDLIQTRSDILASISKGNSPANPKSFQLALAEIDAKLNASSTASLKTLTAETINLDQKITGLRGQMRRAFLASDLSPQLLTEIYAIQQDTSIARAQYDNLVLRMRDLDTQANIQIADSRVVSPALEPVTPTFPNRSLVLLVALAASMGFGVSLAFLNEYYIGGITSASQLGELLQTPVAATIPARSGQNSGQLSHAETIIDAPLSIYSESVRKLRAAIDQKFKARGGGDPPQLSRGGKTILITSALANEGKTTAALSLARTYAQAGQKTLLIDADLRQPSVHLHLGFEPQIGFLDYLRNASETDLTGSFYARDPASSLALIMGAARSEFPTDQLLSSATFEALLAQAKEVYDVVIIDSPPLLPVVDARYIAHYADAVVMVVKWAATGQGDLKSAVQPLRDAMRPGSALHPVLVQVKDRTAKPELGSYGDGYSAAI
ncbi:MAG: polysaccharide biosynthesis tyrosine autokinase [Paracoccaceae bacterium]